MVTDSATGFDFARSMERVRRWLWVLAGVGAVGFAVRRDTSWGFSFLCGALLAMAGFHLTHRVVLSLGPGMPARPGWRGLVFAARYLLMGAALWAGAEWFGLRPIGALLGLLTPAAAVLLELIRETALWLRRGSLP